MPAQIAQCLDRLTAAFPGVSMSEQTARVWAEHLGHVAVDDAAVACRRIERGSDRFPSIKAFLEATNAAARDRRATTIDAPGLPEPPIDAEMARANLRRLRETLAAVGRKA